MSLRESLIGSTARPTFQQEIIVHPQPPTEIAHGPLRLKRARTLSPTKFLSTHPIKSNLGSLKEV